jgi:hypothetical protein
MGGEVGLGYNHVRQVDIKALAEHEPIPEQ